MKKSIRKLGFNMALKSSSKFQVGAVVFKKNILSAGFNQKKSHPLLKRIGNKFMVGIHAEIHACIGLSPDQMEGASIFVIRLKQTGEVGLAKPCGMCQAFLRDMGFKDAYFTTDSGKIERIKF